MNEILFYDSGVGGIALLNKLRILRPYENYIYFADNKNMPYGNKEYSDVLSLVISNIKNIITKNTNCVVIACNTITSQMINDIRKEFETLQIFGIEPEIKSVSNEPSLLIATPQTCVAVANKVISSGKNITVHPAFNLANIIENNLSDKEVIHREIIKIKTAHAQKFQSLILGCTHYALVKDIFAYAFPHCKNIYDGINGTAKNIAEKIQQTKAEGGGIKLILTKESKRENLKYISLINVKNPNEYKANAGNP